MGRHERRKIAKKAVNQEPPIELVNGAVNGNNAYMGMILEHYRDDVFGIADHYTQLAGKGYDHFLKEDITQDTLMDISKAIRKDFWRYWEHYKKYNNNDIK